MTCEEAEVFVRARDLDGDGKLDVDEVERLLRDKLKSKLHEEAVAMVQVADKDGDGKVSPSELVAVLASGGVSSRPSDGLQDRLKAK